MCFCSNSLIIVARVGFLGNGCVELGRVEAAVALPGCEGFGVDQGRAAQRRTRTIPAALSVFFSPIFCLFVCFPCFFYPLLAFFPSTIPLPLLGSQFCSTISPLSRISRISRNRRRHRPTDRPGPAPISPPPSFFSSRSSLSPLPFRFPPASTAVTRTGTAAATSLLLDAATATVIMVVVVVVVVSDWSQIYIATRSWNYNWNRSWNWG